ncbi:hypothetical protein PHYSODRAFT_298802 [Phytophthora sojae]|uniref:Uncharacterized protein n=1 Tax=Phytophthora sojae (strain P6497) TaxID=1094619 RepID=G4Z4J4_PHYSP|nr:hypothetical protein PHYSODRAFT_298802 [Phytophthora sojae]EGZ20838.1 hypothetical protein PHYSODRAFT_298802 [Phytophthora sojae]|eukprot:XP_009523555.1 hypothetical protein PHYSODRAFT_298802 [Phytophthora sojae]
MVVPKGAAVLAPEKQPVPEVVAALPAALVPEAVVIVGVRVAVALGTQVPKSSLPSESRLRPSVRLKLPQVPEVASALRESAHQPLVEVVAALGAPEHQSVPGAAACARSRRPPTSCSQCPPKPSPRSEPQSVPEAVDFLRQQPELEVSPIFRAPEGDTSTVAKLPSSGGNDATEGGASVFGRATSDSKGRGGPHARSLFQQDVANSLRMSDVVIVDDLNVALDACDWLAQEAESYWRSANRHGKIHTVTFACRNLDHAVALNGRTWRPLSADTICDLYRSFEALEVQAAAQPNCVVIDSNF